MEPIFVFACIASLIIVMLQIYGFFRLMRRLKAEKEAGNGLAFKDSSLVWYLSQGALFIFSAVMIFVAENDVTARSIFVILSGLFLANVIVGMTSKRLYYNQNGFLYSSGTFIPFNKILSIERVGKSKTYYQIQLADEEPVFVEKAKALFLQERLIDYQEKHSNKSPE